MFWIILAIIWFIFWIVCPISMAIRTQDNDYFALIPFSTVSFGLILILVSQQVNTNHLDVAYNLNDGNIGFKDVKVFERKDGTIWIVDNDIFIRRFTSELFNNGRGDERDLQNILQSSFKTGYRYRIDGNYKRIEVGGIHYYPRERSKRNKLYKRREIRGYNC